MPWSCHLARWNIPNNFVFFDSQMAFQPSRGTCILKRQLFLLEVSRSCWFSLLAKLWDAKAHQLLVFLEHLGQRSRWPITIFNLRNSHIFLCLSPQHPATSLNYSFQKYLGHSCIRSSFPVRLTGSDFMVAWIGFLLSVENATFKMTPMIPIYSYDLWSIEYMDCSFHCIQFNLWWNNCIPGVGGAIWTGILAVRQRLKAESKRESKRV